jgi:asparagine synthase (glutamine-hydrolysing)
MDTEASRDSFGVTAAEAPYFHVRRGPAGLETSGTPSCALGHRLPRPDGGTDDGVFVAWSWDGRRLRVQNDRYGFYPLYYFVGPSEACVSPSIPALITRGAPLAIDDEALAVFLRLGFFIGEDTPLRGVRALPPHATFEWDVDTGLSLAGRLHQPAPERMARPAVIDGYIERFRQAIARRPPAPGRWAVPLSGGRDSRHIVLELARIGCRPTLCVMAQPFPPQVAEDVEVAVAVVSALDLPHVVLEQPRSRLAAELRKNVTTGFCSDEHAWLLVVGDFLATSRTATAYDGIGGDVLSAGLFLDEDRHAALAGGRLDDAAELLFGIFRKSESGLRAILPADQYIRSSRPVAVERLRRELIRHVDAANPVGSFFFWNRTRREIALSPYGILHPIHVYSPYLDHDVFDLLAAIPAEMLLDHQLHTETILSAYPHYRHIPFERKQPRRLRDRRHAARFGLELARYALRHLPSRLVRGSFLLPRLQGLGATTVDAVLWFDPILVILLLQLGEAMAAAPGQPSWTRSPRLPRPAGDGAHAGSMNPRHR